MKHVVMFSGGIGSWAAAKRVAARHGTADLTLLFTDTLIEDPDLYRFLDEAAADIGGTLVRIAEGRTPWQVFNDERFLGNSRIDPCSKILKRQMADRWLKANCDPADTTIYLGIDWTEDHRFTSAKARYASNGWSLEAPMCEAPYTLKDHMLRDLEASGIKAPRLYAMGFAHNNCGGWCVKAGQGHFAHLLRMLPDVYAANEAQEDAIRDRLGDVAMMKDAAGKPLTMKSLREKIEGLGQYDMFDIGGCGCFSEASI